MTSSSRIGPRVQARGVVVIRDGRTIIDHVDIDVEPGQVLAVTGASGAGKSTLLWVLAGLIEPEEGTVEPQDRAGHSAVVFQGYGLLPVLTAQENVELPLQVKGVPADEARQRAAAALERAGLGELPDRLAEELSGGQRQRVAVARALAISAGLLVADEPTAELDADTASVVFAALRAEADAGATVVLATNDPDIAALCDRVIRLVDGAITPEL